MEISEHLLEARSLNRTISARATGLLSMLTHRGFTTDEHQTWVRILQDSIALHERCEEELAIVLKRST
jgi:hypothetical protein